MSTAADDDDDNDDNDGDDSQYVLSTYYVPNTALSPLMFTTCLGHRCYCLHFTNERRLNHLLKVTYK